MCRAGGRRGRGRPSDPANGLRRNRLGIGVDARQFGVDDERRRPRFPHDAGRLGVSNAQRQRVVRPLEAQAAAEARAAPAEGEHRLERVGAGVERFEDERALRGGDLDRHGRHEAALGAQPGAGGHRALARRLREVRWQLEADVDRCGRRRRIQRRSSATLWIGRWQPTRLVPPGRCRCGGTPRPYGRPGDRPIDGSAQRRQSLRLGSHVPER
jgi:hypothetical protein